MSKKYRLLNDLELLMEGDEYLDNDGQTWVKVPLGESVFQKALMSPVRREIKEPVVLSADELCETVCDEVDYNRSTWRTIVECAEKADKNGQLREYCRPEQVELREAITEFLAHYDERHTFDGRALNIFNKLRKLKPPHERQL